MNKYAAISRELASKRRRDRACKTKVSFDTAEQARQKGQYFYRCRFCRKFHRTGQAVALAAQLRRRFGRS